MNDISKIIEKLENNFLFHASLGSKELFHSNILAWLLGQRDKYGEMAVLKIFVEQFANMNFPPYLNTDDNPDFRINREENNIDIVIKWRDEENLNFIYIENKIKSIPTSRQLKEYDQKIDKLDGTKTELDGSKNNFIKKLNIKVIKKLLLTPLTQDIPTNSVFKWKNITYQDDILEFLGKIKTIEFVNPDVRYVLNRYNDFIQNLIGLMHFYNVGFENSDKFKGMSYDFYTEQFHAVRKIRIDDLILKIVHQKISFLIEEKLRDKDLNIVAESDMLKNKPGAIYLTSSFTRKDGISDIKICVKKEQMIGLQLQGNTLKYLVEVFDKKLANQNKKFAYSLIENKLWFYEGQGENKKLLSGKGHNKIELKIDDKVTFNSYGLNFIYLNKDVSEYAKKSIYELTDFIVSEIENVIDNLDTFKMLSK